MAYSDYSFLATRDDLFIMDNNSLTSLEGLNNLTSVAQPGYRLGVGTVDDMIIIGPYQKHFSITSNENLCTYMAEELRDQVQLGLGAGIVISENKDCSTH